MRHFFKGILLSYLNHHKAKHVKYKKRFDKKIHISFTSPCNSTGYIK